MDLPPLLVMLPKMVVEYRQMIEIPEKLFMTEMAMQTHEEFFISLEVKASQAESSFVAPDLLAYFL